MFSPQERKDLTKMLIDLMDVPQQVEVAESEEDWGKIFYSCWMKLVL